MPRGRPRDDSLGRDAILLLADVAAAQAVRTVHVLGTDQVGELLTKIERAREIANKIDRPIGWKPDEEKGVE